MLQNEWTSARNEMIGALVELGHPRELGEEIAKNLESPKAMRRMTAYVRYVKPRKAELVVDEMLAIRSEILSWREKKACCIFSTFEKSRGKYKKDVANVIGLMLK